MDFKDIKEINIWDNTLQVITKECNDFYLDKNTDGTITDLTLHRTPPGWRTQYGQPKAILMIGDTTNSCLN